MIGYEPASFNSMSGPDAYITAPLAPKEKYREIFVETFPAMIVPTTSVDHSDVVAVNSKPDTGNSASVKIFVTRAIAADLSGRFTGRGGSTPKLPVSLQTSFEASGAHIGDEIVPPPICDPDEYVHHAPDTSMYSHRPVPVLSSFPIENEFLSCFTTSPASPKLLARFRSAVLVSFPALIDHAFAELPRSGKSFVTLYDRS